MGLTVEFESIINPEKYKFVYDSNSWDNAPVAPYFLYREMRMDGSWKYSERLPVSLVGEYLISLASVMMVNDELVRSLGYKLPSEPSDDAFVLASKVVYKEGKKKRYFSREFNRISSVKAKQYDKRWSEITPEMDGSPEAILKFIAADYTPDTLSQFVRARKLRSWLRTGKRRRTVYMDYAAEFIGWTKDYHDVHAIESAWDNVQIALKIYEQKREFENNIANYNQNAMVTKLGQ